MNTENFWANASITPADIEAVVRKARADRAEVMRETLAELPALVKRLLASVRPNRARQGGALA